MLTSWTTALSLQSLLLPTLDLQSLLLPSFQLQAFLLPFLCLPSCRSTFHLQSPLLPTLNLQPLRPQPLLPFLGPTLNQQTLPQPRPLNQQPLLQPLLGPTQLCLERWRR